METQKLDAERQTQATPFQAALNLLIGMRKWGAGRIIAGKAGISQGYFSELVTGRKDGSEPKRRAVAKAFGLSYDMFLYLGEQLLAGRPKEEVLRLAEIFKRLIAENKAPSELTPEEHAAFTEYIAPRWQQWTQLRDAQWERLAGQWQGAFSLRNFVTHDSAIAHARDGSQATATINGAREPARNIAREINAPVSAGGASELARALCRQITTHMGNMDTDGQVAFYTRIKAVMNKNDEN